MKLAALARALVGLDRGQAARVDDEILAELEFHVAERARENVEAGMPAEEARRDAERRFGNIQRVREACRWVHIGERIMLQRLHLALTIVLLISTVGFGIAHFARRQELSLALQGGSRSIWDFHSPYEKRDVVIGVGDTIDVIKTETWATVAPDAVVAADGCVLLPGVGWVEVIGLTRPEAEELISKLYREKDELDASASFNVRVTKAAHSSALGARFLP